MWGSSAPGRPPTWCVFLRTARHGCLARRRSRLPPRAIRPHRPTWRRHADQSGPGADGARARAAAPHSRPTAHGGPAGLAEAARTRPDGLRYAAAHLAALRAAAAVLAARARPAPTRRNRITSVWVLLAGVAPELDEWASYFALGAGKRAAAEAGIPRVVTAREADDLLRAAEEFVTVVEQALGLAHQPAIDGLVA